MNLWKSNILTNNYIKLDEIEGIKLMELQIKDVDALKNGLVIITWTGEVFIWCKKTDDKFQLTEEFF